MDYIQSMIVLQLGGESSVRLCYSKLKKGAKAAVVLKSLASDAQRSIGLAHDMSFVVKAG